MKICISNSNSNYKSSTMKEFIVAIIVILFESLAFAEPQNKVRI